MATRALLVTSAGFPLANRRARAAPSAPGRRGSLAAPPGVLDGGEGFLRAAPSPRRRALAGLEVLVDAEEMLDLVARLGLHVFYGLQAAEHGVADGHRDHLGVR